MADSNNGGAVVWLVLIGGVLLYILSGNTGSEDSGTYERFGAAAPAYSTGSASAPLSRDDALSEHWDEIRGYLNGTQSVEACSESGSCYSLDADLSNGSIDTLHFNNGGWLSLDADIDSDGSASGIDQRGRSWTFDIDMNSADVDDAVREWAEDNGVELEP